MPAEAMEAPSLGTEDENFSKGDSRFGKSGGAGRGQGQNRRKMIGMKGRGHGGFNSGGGRGGRKGKGKYGGGYGGDGNDDNLASIRDATDSWAMQAILLEDMKNSTRAGQVLDTRDMDPMDAFITDLVHESMKTSDASTTMVMDLPQNRLSQVPQPRATAELWAGLKPNDSVMAGAAPGTLPYQLGQRSWEVVGSNHYYSDVEREKITRLTVNLAGSTLSHVDTLEDDDIDRIFDPSWRKGRAQIEKDAIEAANRVTTTEVFEAQGEADWSQDAVVDEDDL